MCVAERSGAFDMQISGAAIRIRVPPEKVLRSTSRVPHVGTRVQEHPVEIFQVYRAAFVFPCFDQQRFNAPVIDLWHACAARAAAGARPESRILWSTTPHFAVSHAAFNAGMLKSRSSLNELERNSGTVLEIPRNRPRRLSRGNMDCASRAAPAHATS